MPSERLVYLDCAASAPERPESLAVAARVRALRCCGANPNSLHTLGREAARELDGARARLARALGAGFRPAEVAFTSGGTESTALAVLGMAEGARGRDRSRTRVVISAIEHDSVLELAAPLRDRGFEVVLAAPGRDGVVAPAEVARLAREAPCALVSVMAANNETGVVQPTRELAEAAHAAGALFHADAVQGFCKTPLDLSGADAVSVAAHKVGGPVGVGALAMRMRCPFRRQSFGGGQEGGRRSGTQDVIGACCFAAVAESVSRSMGETAPVVSGRSRRLVARLCAPGTGVVATTGGAAFGSALLPGLVSVMVPGAESESLIVRLDEAGFEVSAGSACSSGSLEPSHVLSAMGIARDEALGSLRISFDERTAEADLDAFAEALLRVAGELAGAAARHGGVR